jgi:hypothetical protein
MKEIISIHIGKAGANTGNAVWENIINDHSI